ncbi:trypsin-like peptidase domain-containing protein [Mucilaginibacter sp. UR6-1]|uniref:trypsin-like peptidase domain-containing protein n=1 Tax=Mucilaginibacter sp. UR6-1 TaxID=1435643 RepID=UPI001E62F94F|nr:trypsin-like peptidase domain-containing protein [Mucilaginibacter sp. UR6-1]MCC8410775.1 trypsin-like peptidase domain-containing protein [Mucilaginibacter sp. UR6-1]
MMPGGNIAVDGKDTAARSVYFSNVRSGGRSSTDVPEFRKAAALVTRSIVHIKVKLNRPDGARNGYDPYYGSSRAPAQVMASGSGVIFSKDGYIITNNHVVEGATAIEVILTDKRIFPAKLVGRDPNTDLAVIQIDTHDLTPIVIGNSDDVEIGEWVLAAGYPFSLNTTVTAGIVSAKERSIGIIGQPEEGRPATASAVSSAVEAYIQTDAAINPGNSGGALVNTSGQLIGINAAIASQTGSYEGYGFAIPVNLAEKIVNDLIKYGKVKRGLLGVSFPSPATEDQFLIQQGIKPGSVQGAYVTDVQKGSAAAAGGLMPGDIIQEIDGTKISSSVELSERIARHNPGDKLKLVLKRGDKQIDATVTLKAQESTDLAEENLPAPALSAQLGASFAPLSEAFKQHYQLNTGLAVTAIDPKGLFARIGIPTGTIILSINGGRITSVNEMAAAFKAARNGIVRFECVTPDGSRIVFNLSLGA